MNEIERAIAYWKEFEAEIDGLYAETNKSGRIELDKQRPAVEVALAALQEREEWKPCWLCSISSGEPAKHLILPETCNNEAKYCPECGRPLTEEAWAELEKRLRG